VTQPHSEFSFEELLDKLETIVKSLENDELGLEKTIDVYEEGLKLAAECNRRLSEAEKRLEIIRKTADGDIVGEPFDPDSETVGEG